MSERASIRGGRGGRGGRGDSTGRGGRGGYSGDHKGQQDRPKKESILDLKKYAGKAICVKFSGGREVTGTLKGYDQLMNLVLDNVQEIMTDDGGNSTTRALGLVVARGTVLTSISPVAGSKEIDNPFGQEEG